MASLADPQSHPAGVLLVCFNYSLWIRYVASMLFAKSHPGGAWLVAVNNGERIRHMGHLDLFQKHWRGLIDLLQQ